MTTRLTFTGTPRMRRAFAAIARDSPQVLHDAFSELGAMKTRQASAAVRDRDSRLAASLSARVSGRAATLAVRIGSPLPQAAITHFGGTIRTRENAGRPVTPAIARRRVFGAKRINYLTIPLTRLGTPKHARARDYQQLFVFKSRRGKLYLAQRLTSATSRKTRRTRTGFAGRNSAGLQASKGRTFRILFALRESVTIKPHPYLAWNLPEDRRFLAESISNQYNLHLARVK